MEPKTDIVRLLAADPGKSYTTSHLVEAVFPRDMHSIREQLHFGTKAQKAASQRLKSKLHRNVLYYVSRLVEEGVLEVARVDAHGEKVYRLAAQHVVAKVKRGEVHLARPALHLPWIEDELAQGACRVYDPVSALHRTNSTYINAAGTQGLGHLTQLVDAALRCVNDVVCIGDFQSMIQRYDSEDLSQFINTLAIQTLDESSAVCLLLDTRHSDVAPFVQMIARQLPRRVYAVFLADARSLVGSDFQACVQALQARNEKVNVHFVPARPEPLWVGRAGPYGFSTEAWRALSTRTQPGVVLASHASVLVDLRRFSEQPPHLVRETLLRSTKALFGITTQQRFLDEAPALASLGIGSRELFAWSSAMLRVWNYDWEQGHEVISSAQPDIDAFVRQQVTLYRACGLPVDFHVQVSSAFARFNPQLSARSYRKWTITSTRDLDTPEFAAYTKQRLQYLRTFQGIDRFRIFRGGNPTGEDVGKEILRLGHQGFPLITIDFAPLVGVRRLTEYFS